MSQPSHALLRLAGISKRYGSVVANAAIDLTVMPGSIHAILGENGAGKSTLMKLIYGVERPDEGQMQWQGREVVPASPADARALGIGMVFQHFSLFETLTVTENIALIVPGRRRELAARLRELGDAYGLSVNPDAHVHALSVGERQRVEILRCLLLNPKLLILDEPTSVLAPQNVERLFDTLRQLRDDGMSILFISHKLDEIRALCDRATILRGGQVSGEVDPREHSATELATLMIGRAMPAPLPADDTAPGEERLSIRSLTWRPSDPFAPVLRIPSLSVRAGEIVGIAGVSGNGQASLASILSGEIALPAAEAATLELAGEAAGSLGVAARRQRGLAFIPEERLGRGAVPDMSLADNTLLTAHRRGLVRRGFIDRTREAAATRACMEHFDVRAAGPRIEAAALSGGNLQKFIVGRELSLEPSVLLVSQPTWGVDIGAAAAIRRRLVEMRNEGTAILVISEELEELYEICDRLHVLYHGELSPSLPLPDTAVAEVGEWMTGAQRVASHDAAADTAGGRAHAG